MWAGERITVRTKALLLTAPLVMLLSLVLTGRLDAGVGQSAYAGTGAPYPYMVLTGLLTLAAGAVLLFWRCFR